MCPKNTLWLFLCSLFVIIFKRFLAVIHHSVSWFHSSRTKVHWHCSWPTSQPSPFSLTISFQEVSRSACPCPLFLCHVSIFQIHPMFYALINRKETRFDLLLHIHSAVGSSFLWLCHPLMAFSFFFKSAFSVLSFPFLSVSLGIPLG